MHAYIDCDKWWYDWYKLLLLLADMAKGIDVWPIVLLKLSWKHTHKHTHVLAFVIFYRRGQDGKVYMNPQC